MWNTTGCCLLWLLAAAMPVYQTVAQSEPPRQGPFLRIGVGLGNATNNLGNGTNYKTGFVGSVHAGLGSRRVQAVLALDWQPFRVRSTGTDDAVRLWYFIGGVQFFLNRQIYLRPGVGLARADWSGPGTPFFSYNYNDWNPAAAVALGAEWRVWRAQWLATELGVRGATCFGDCSFQTRLLSLQVMVPFY